MSTGGKLKFAGRYSTQRPTPLIHMAPGHIQTIYLTASGTVYDFGSDNQGQLANGMFGRTDFSSTPIRVNLPVRVKQVGSGLGTCWAVSANGRSAYAWGGNLAGQLGIDRPGVERSTTPRKIDFHLPPGVKIVKMADGLMSNMALLSNGKVLAWGDNRYGQCGLDPKTYGKFIYKPTVVPRLRNVSQLSAGDYYGMALTKNGTVWAWGQNASGELGRRGPTPSATAHSYKPVRVTGLPRIADIAVGGRNGIAVDRKGHVWEWGRNEFGELGRGNIDLHDKAHPTPKMVEGLPPIVSLDSEGPTVLATDAKGNVYAWGFDKWGGVGDGSTANTGTPHLVLTLPTSPDGQEPSVQVAEAHFTSYAYNVVTGQTYAWGRDNYGQAGFPANHVANPVPVDISSEIDPTLTPVCFLAGTRIRTSRGETAIEALAVGDLVVTASGAVRPVKWLGRRQVACRRHPDPARALPVRIAAHTFGDSRPARALLVSPGHAICVDVDGGRLIPAGALIDGASIRQIDVETADYWHVELDTHDLVLAENLACESYLETGNRAFFGEDGVVGLHASPDRTVAGHGDACRPFLSDGPAVDAVRLRLRARADWLGRSAVQAA